MFLMLGTWEKKKETKRIASTDYLLLLFGRKKKEKIFVLALNFELLFYPLTIVYHLTPFYPNERHKCLPSFYSWRLDVAWRLSTAFSECRRN